MWFGGNSQAPQASDTLVGGGGGGASGSSLAGEQTKQTEKISFHLKTSIFTRRVTLDRDRLALGVIKQLAVAFLQELYFQHPYPANTPIGDHLRRHFPHPDSHQQLLQERLLLRKYQPAQDSFLPFNSAADIEADCYIGIEISERHLLTCPSSASNQADHHHQAEHQPTSVKQTSEVRMAHEFRPESFLFPTYCAACSTLIKGVFRQGYKCHQCRRNYCPICRSKADQAGDTCLPPASNQAPAICANLSASASVASSSQAPAYQSSSDEAGAGAGTGKGEKQGEQMSKRKSATNLLHFNIANPFKSHQTSTSTSSGATPKQADEAKTKEREKGRGSAGGLEPVMKQLSKSRREQQPSADQSGSSGGGKGPTNTLGVQVAANLSVSHQDLSTKTENAAKKLVMDDTAAPALGALTVAAAGTALGGRHSGQLSASARASAHDLHHHHHHHTKNPSNACNNSQSPVPKTQNHTFISMDWIQLSDESLCGVCSKSLRQAGSGSGSNCQAPSLCQTCRLQVHAQCQSLVLADCLQRLAESTSRAAASETTIRAAESDNLESTNNAMPLQSTNSNVSRENIRLHRLAPSVKHVKRPDKTQPIIEGWLKHTTLADEQARSHYWRLDQTDITLYESDTSTRYFKAIALNKIARVMSARSLPKRVREDVLTGGKYYQPNLDQHGPAVTEEQARAKSAGTSPKRSPELEAQMRAMFAFELATGSMFLVQASSESEASRWSESLAQVIAQHQKGDAQAGEENNSSSNNNDNNNNNNNNTVNKLVESVNSLCLEETSSSHEASTVVDERLASARATTTTTTSPTPTGGYSGKLAQEKPLQPSQQRQQQAAAAAAAVARHHHGGASRGASRAHVDPNRSRLYNRPRKTIRLDPMAIPDHYIEGKYLVERDREKGYGFEELGCGQFGKVYAAIAEWKAEDAARGLWSGVPVAIKEISKARFDLRQQAKLKNEANILSRLDHPGVIILERVHDLPDKIYIVMEQLEDDMLEMIMSTEEKRLSERITKFLTYQILEALKYLHAQNIAHCDLKPENVLLVERRSQFPQIKLCDFGFAKIIEDNSFRSSLVGTPAYLAPEVVKGERYNRSVDLWSVGVIVYVSLSGEFPFNEGENIHDQISRANFMFPDQPWARISKQAKDFITILLQVNCEKRLSASRAQMDNWIQDYQLWCDLSELEVRVGKRWVTDDADYDRWSRYAREHNLQLPRSAIQLHDELMND